MASRQRNAPHSEAQSSPKESAQPAGPTWRQPPPETRASIRRKQMTVPTAKAAVKNPLAPLLMRLTGLGESMAPRHWIALLVLTAAAVGMNQLLTLQRFTVTAANVRIRGTVRASVDEIYDASGLEGTNVFRVQAESAAGRVAQLPGLESAEVHLRLPASAIIDVVELAPIAIIQTITETLWIGSDGNGIQQVGEPPKLKLVEVSGTVRDDRGVVLPEIVRGLEVILANRPDLTEIYYGILEGLYFRDPGGYTVYLGDGGAMTRKLTLLEATQQQVAEQGLSPQEIDLRFDGYAMLR